MNPVPVVSVLALLVFVVAVTAFITRAVTRVEPEKKLFGLDQLRCAKKHGAQTAEQIRLVLAVVCEVCGYDNTVAKDFEALVSTAQHDIGHTLNLIQANEADIDTLRDSNADLVYRNNIRREDISEAKADLQLVQDSTRAC